MTDEGRELLGNIQGPIAARLIAISQARFAAGGSTNIISMFRRSSRPICRSPDSLQEMAGHRHPGTLSGKKRAAVWPGSTVSEAQTAARLALARAMQILLWVKGS